MRRVLSLAACAALASIYSGVSLATPYASQISASGGTVSFRMNEAADNVTIKFEDNSTLNLGSMTMGAGSFALGTHTSYQIISSKVSGAGFLTKAPSSTGTFSQGVVLQTSNDANKPLWFNSPRGVAVDTDPTSPGFGRIFVSNSAAGTVGTAPNTRAVGDGLYTINPDLTDPYGYGDTAQTGGITWTLSTNSPWHLNVGPDHNLYVSDWSDAHGGAFRVDPNLQNGTELLAGTGDTSNPTVHGSIASKIVMVGTGANMKMYALDEDLTGDPPTSKNPNGATTYQSLFRWDVGTSVGYNSPPTKISDFPSAVNGVAGVLVDLGRAPDGKFFLSENRNLGTEPGLVVLADDGTKLWDSLTATRAALGDTTATDVIKDVQAMQVSPDGKFVAMVALNSDFIIVPIDQGTGLPDITQTKFMDAGNISNGRDIAIDAAGNVYMVTSGHARLRIYGEGGSEQTVYDSATGTLSRTYTDITNAKWSATGGGTISDSTKWTGGIVPAGAGYSATFPSTITAPSTIDIGSGTFTTGSLWIDTPNTLTFGGSGTLAFASGNAGFTNTGIVVSAGSHVVNVPVVANANFVTTVPTNSSVTYNGNVTVGGAWTLLYNVGSGGSITMNNVTANAATAYAFNVGTAGLVSIANLQTGTNNAALSGTLLTGATASITGSPRISNINLFVGQDANFNVNNVNYGTTQFSVTKNGDGTLSIPSLNASTLTINKGLIKTGVNAGTSIAKTMVIATDQSGFYSATLDLNQKMVYDYTGGTPMALVRDYLNQGYNGGGWTGKGIISSAALASLSANNKGALAYFEASQNGTTSFGGVTVDTTAICMMYTSMGDATLDGKTDTQDFNVLAGQFGTTSATTINGDFNYDSVVDSNDFNVLAAGYGSKIALAAPSLGAVVPEPATLSLLGLGSLMALRRRRAC